MGFFEKLKAGLSKTKASFSSALDNIFRGRAKVDGDLYDEIEELLITADMGVLSSTEILDELQERVGEKHIRQPEEVREELLQIMKEKLLSSNQDTDFHLSHDQPTIITVVGVNGVGKTTTIAKMANYFQKEGYSVLLAAADTFRAAAIDQLKTWADRTGVPIVAREEGADPASVVYDALHSVQSRHFDVLIIDTAGRQQTNKNLMNELEKIKRVVKREFPDAKKEGLLVVDATTGQNAVAQAKEFKKAADISGIVITKLDGTAKGGVIFPLQLECQVPVKFIGVGEGVDDLRPFDVNQFVQAIFEE